MSARSKQFPLELAAVARPAVMTVAWVVLGFRKRDQLDRKPAQATAPAARKHGGIASISAIKGDL